MAIYYVDTDTGSNDNAGTYALPFAQIVKAEASASNGDTVYVKSGSYVEPSSAGGATGCWTSAKAITWIAVKGWDASGVPTLGGSVEVTAASGTVGVYQSGNTTTSFTGFTINGNGQSYALLNSGAVGTKTWNDSTFLGGTTSNFDLNQSGAANITMNNCTFIATGSARGIYARGGSVLTVNNSTFSSDGTGGLLDIATVAGTVTINNSAMSRSGNGYGISNYVDNSVIIIDGLTVTNYAMGSHALIYPFNPATVTVNDVTATINNGYFINAPSTATTTAITVTNSTVTAGAANLPFFNFQHTGPVTLSNNVFTSGRAGSAAIFYMDAGATSAVDGGATTLTNNTFISTAAGTSGAIIHISERYDDFTFTGNTVTSTNTSNDCALLYVLNAKAPTISDNVLSSVGTNTQEGIWVYQTEAVDPSIATISRNKVYTRSVAGYAIALGTEATSLGDNLFDGSIIEHNEVYGPGYFGGTATTIHSIFYGFNKKGHIRYNYVNGGAYGLVVKSDNFDWDHTAGVYGNIFVNNNYMGIYNKGSVNLDIFNNTVYSSASFTPDIGGIVALENDLLESSGTTIYNNIVVNPKGDYLVYIGADDETNVSISNNLYFNEDGTAVDTKFNFAGTAYTTLATWAAATGDTSSMYADPQFLDLNMTVPKSAKIRYRSSARGRGTAVTTTGVTFSRDYFEKIIRKLSIGAHSPVLKSMITT